MASTAPSPLYEVYQARWHFSSAMLTAVFAVYAGPVMLTLALFGALSDTIGRRRMAFVAISTILIALVTLALARNVWWVFGARALQGFGVGIGATTLTAAVVDGGRSETAAAASVATVASNIGVAVGALGAGLFLVYAPDPATTLFAVLAAIFFLSLNVVRLLPDSRKAASTPRRLLGFRIGVPDRSRLAFWLYSAVLFVTWSVGGLYLSLGPSIAALDSPSTSHLVGAATVAILGFVGAIVTAAFHRWSDHLQIATGAPALMAGLLVVLWSCVVRSEELFLFGSIVLSCGWGLLNIGSFRGLVGLSNWTNRAAVLSSVYLMSYFAFSVPSMIAGVATDHFGLRQTTIVFGLAGACVTLVVSIIIAASWRSEIARSRASAR